jgi:RNA polymerase sigma factor (sigma-70 family)
MPRTPQPSRRSIAERNALVEQHVRLVYHVAARMPDSLGTKDERISDGMLGLIRAAERYDESLGFTFATFAGRCIWGFIIREHRGRTNVPGWIYDVAMQARKASAAIEAVEGLPPKPERLEGIVPGATRALTAMAIANTSSLDAPLPEVDGAITLGDAAASYLPDHEDTLARKDEVRRLLEAARLSDGDRRVVERRANGETLQEIGDSLGVSRGRVQQLERRALSKLRATAARLSARPPTKVHSDDRPRTVARPPRPATGQSGP